MDINKFKINFRNIFSFDQAKNAGIALVLASIFNAVKRKKNLKYFEGIYVQAHIHYTMPFQEKEGVIEWKVHFASPIKKVYEALSTDVGRKKFWAEETKEENGFIEFTFFNYPKTQSKILEKEVPILFRIEYFETDVTFKLKPTLDSGTDLTLINRVANEKLKHEMTAGWVSVLMAMKAAVDFGVDLRNHNPQRTWDHGYLDN